ncbi:hypothetical protein KFK09_008454 [Dendrobium nobile]|uniref:Integrase catalytic domain-containing protein n=1 Tax=Dendrobium nobile TaxID=94219 RepID=A0A8T3BL65_DENNO|nr:hypothetical protein KFK09_008454 [Dendrobium nobile]
MASNNHITHDWIIDSRASSHLTNNLDNGQQPSKYNGQDSVSIGDGRSIPIAHSGQGLLPTPTPSGFYIKDKRTNNTLSGPCSVGLYQLTSSHNNSQAFSAATTSSSRWHRRLGHLYQQVLSTISRYNRDLAIPLFNTFCSICKATKGHKLPVPTSLSHTYKPLEFIHMDVWGPSPITSNQGFKYYIVFIDDSTRFTWVSPLMFKSDVFSAFTSFHVVVEKQLSCTIKNIRSDGRTEFLNNKFRQ